MFKCILLQQMNNLKNQTIAIWHNMNLSLIDLRDFAGKKKKGTKICFVMNLIIVFDKWGGDLMVFGDWLKYYSYRLGSSFQQFDIDCSNLSTERSF